MTPLRSLALACTLLPLLHASVQAGELEDQVRSTEQAFADTMADRDFEAFQSFLAEQATFWSANGADQGKAAVAQRWANYFEGETAPFAWAPEHVMVLESGDLAFSSGPVYDPAGQQIATFNSVWRLEADGQWRIIFDKGNRYCAPSPTRD